MEIVKKVLIALLIVGMLAAGIVLPVMHVASGEDYYIVDKGFALSYVDKYTFIHDDVFWFVLGNDDEQITLFVNPQTWYHYAVGQTYTGRIDNFIVYEGDDSIARHLGKEHINDGNR